VFYVAGDSAKQNWLSRMWRPASEGGPYKRKEHKQEWLGNKSVVFAGEFSTWEAIW
jgi:hypothetical protein